MTCLESGLKDHFNEKKSKNKNVFIAGITSGIGEDLAQLYLEDGAAV
jgi:NADP-dependent 3-hydroxy acid dehydrogenase YdfG